MPRLFLLHKGKLTIASPQNSLGTPVDLGDFNMRNIHFQAIKSLLCNEQILITKPDKGSGVIILNKYDYIKKMGSIRDDKIKLLKMESAPIWS